MASELDALQWKKTWSQVPPSSDHNIIGCRWFYKIKRNAEGSVSRYKLISSPKAYINKSVLILPKHLAWWSNHPQFVSFYLWLLRINGLFGNSM
jgi:hypothetical protein